MTDLDAEQLRFRALKLALRWGLGRATAQDIAQSAIVKMLEKPNQGRTVKQTVVDSIRDLCGRTHRQKRGTLERHRFLTSTRPGCGDYRIDGVWLNRVDFESSNPWPLTEARLDLKTLLVKLPKRERFIATEFFLRGVPTGEIAKTLGIPRDSAYCHQSLAFIKLRKSI